MDSQSASAMKITIAAIGLLKRGPEHDLIAEYSKRLPWTLEIKQHEVKGGGTDSDTLKRKEAEWLLAQMPASGVVIAMDERGKSLTSQAFSQTMQKYAERSGGNIGFIIGGAFGLAENIRNRSDLVLQLSDMTLPHMLARAVLVEQLYRAYTIHTGHPYHK